ncbi:MAG: hypothetical protein JKY54_09940, partial [Flavobacteriales bacterium]|nr:hypothetical protein [Flavobacteriales bacterium]
NQVVFVKGDKLIHFDMKLDRVVKIAYLSKNGLPGVSFKKIDAAMNFGNGKAYFFNGANYCRFDLGNYKADADYPKRTSNYWPGINFEYLSATTNWTNSSFFFLDHRYVKFNNKSDQSYAGYPKTISTNTWGAMPFKNIDAAVSSNGKSYFFSGDEYLRYDISSAKMDPGYPKKIASWTALANALGEKSSPKSPKLTTSKFVQPTNWNVSSLDISLGDQQISFDNRVEVEFNANQDPVVLYSFEKDGSYIQCLNSSWMPNKEAIHLKGIYFLDFVIVEGNYYVLAKELAGYSGVGSLDYEEEGNVLLLLKISPNGLIYYKKKLFGHEGVKGGEFFLCTMSSGGHIAYDGTYFHAFVETCGNFTAKGSSKFDVHETDYYLTFDKNGTIRENGSHPWNVSHSSLVQLATGGTGEAFTLTVGDASPFGIVFNYYKDGVSKQPKIIFPDLSKLQYEDMYAASKTTTDAGQIGGLVQIGEYFYTVITTVPAERLPIHKQAKDLLFIKVDKNGNEIFRKWIKKTPNIDETMPHIIGYGNQIFLSYMLRTGEFEYDYKATIAVLNTNGNYVKEPQLSSYYLDYQCRLFNFTNGDVGLLSIKPYASSVEVIQLGQGTLPSAKTLTEVPSKYKGTTVKPMLPINKEQGSADINLTVPEDKNSQFNGSYQTKFAPIAGKGVYCDGVYSNTPGFSLYLDEMDHSNFSVETEFMVSAFQNAPVFSLSQSSRLLDYYLTDEGVINVRLKNNTKIIPSDTKYELNTWHTARVDVRGNQISVYLDGSLLIVTNSKLVEGESIKSCDFSTTNFGSGASLKGYLKHFRVGKAQ